MKTFLLLLCLLPLNLWASWDMELGLGVDGETWKIQHQKFEEGKEETMNMGNYILKMTIKKSKLEKSTIDMVFTLHEKKGSALVLINKGDETIEEKVAREIFAKGEPNQPNSIITIKLIKQ